MMKLSFLSVILSFFLATEQKSLFAEKFIIMFLETYAHKMIYVIRNWVKVFICRLLDWYYIMSTLVLF